MGISYQNGGIGPTVSSHLLGRTAPIDVVDEEEDERADLSFSSLSSLNAFWGTFCRSWNLHLLLCGCVSPEGSQLWFIVHDLVEYF